MLHIVPILCIFLFIFLVEYRFKKHLDEIDKKIKCLEQTNCPYRKNDNKNSI